MAERPLKIGYCLSLSGPLASNGKTARLAHQVWQEHVNGQGGLLGRAVQMLCIDDQTNPALVPDIYKRLLDKEKVDLVIGGYGDSSVAPAMPLIMERQRYFVALMALAVNASLAYPNYFVMIPTGPHPNEALTEGFFNLAASQMPKPKSMAILAADAPFARNPVSGAKEHATRHGFEIVHEAKYPLTTSDFRPVIRELRGIDPDILFLCSYLNDSVGLLKAIEAVGLEPRMVGGSMIGPQNGSIKALLGPLLNGVVNYEYWLPVPTMMFPGIAEVISEYQSRAARAGADPLGYYVAPHAYAQMQILEQAIAGTGTLDDDELAHFTRSHTFKTVLGDVKFADGGSWSEARVLQVQYLNIDGNDLAQFKGVRTQVVVSPSSLTSGTLVYPYAKAKRLK
jgi:branched-chain amino acid transport system substrate-binding protein